MRNVRNYFILKLSWCIIQTQRFCSQIPVENITFCFRSYLYVHIKHLILIFFKISVFLYFTIFYIVFPQRIFIKNTENIIILEITNVVLLYNILGYHCLGKLPSVGDKNIFLLIAVFSSVPFSHSVLSDSLRPHEPQHARPPCPSPTPGVHLNPCPSSQ